MINSLKVKLYQTSYWKKWILLEELNNIKSLENCYFETIDIKEEGFFDENLKVFVVSCVQCGDSISIDLKEAKVFNSFIFHFIYFSEYELIDQTKSYKRMSEL